MTGALKAGITRLDHNHEQYPEPGDLVLCILNNILR